MSATEGPACVCGGDNVQTARTDHWGEGDEAIHYLHYLLKCSRCGQITEDARMCYLNAAGVAAARARHG